jgi:hypothetical protein
MLATLERHVFKILSERNNLVSDASSISKVFEDSKLAKIE